MWERVCPATTRTIPGVATACASAGAKSQDAPG